MSKTIKVIDLLNKIANGEEVPKFIEHKDIIYEYDKEAKIYYEVNQNIGIYMAFDTYELNDYIEIIEEQQDIDIQEIIGLDLEKYQFDITDEFAVDITLKINQLLDAVKQLDEKIKEKK